MGPFTIGMDPYAERGDGKTDRRRKLVIYYIRLRPPCQKNMISFRMVHDLRPAGRLTVRENGKSLPSLPTDGLERLVQG